ncbi:type II toxin-antitoxin system VapC family toxin [Halobacterium noricense]|uniref:type II toxin-antitoxin system VapC family toxin n=1 Tax=Halobacterium noricense TaxID=223182 RepID=UPI001E31FFAE|nr:PIN domain-containing protein [Halobacterium noricense]UHH27223.1 PIN domain-containing protein [Halobacterium noricense]
MAVAVVDSNILIDYKDTTPSGRHEQAEGIIHAIDRGDLPTARITNYVLLESLNWIHERQRHDIAVDLRDRLSESAGFELVHSAQKDFHRAVELFETYDEFAFGDATLTAYMEREGIEYLYSFDDDFDVIEDITRLETPDNPHN